MSRSNFSSVDKFHIRNQRPNLSDRDHKAQRQRSYGNIGNGWPNSIAARGHDDYTIKKEIEKGHKNDYLRHETRSENFVERLDDEQKEYYRQNSAGITPRDHRDLAPKAGQWETSARNHAMGREDPYKRVPYMYPTAQGQTDHYGFMENAYGRVDQARGRREEHERYASRDDDSRRDPHGRPVAYNQGFR